MNRRAFAESLALAALAPALGIPADSLRLAGSSEESPILSGDGHSPVARGDVEDAATLAGTLMAIIRLEYGERLSADDLHYGRRRPRNAGACRETGLCRLSAQNRARPKSAAQAGRTFFKRRRIFRTAGTDKRCE